jgi:ATP-dependent Clp protease protease subunit
MNYNFGSTAGNLPTSRYVLPQFEERTPYGFKRQDPYTKLFEDRIIFLGVQVDDASADDIMAQLLVLESTDPDRDLAPEGDEGRGYLRKATASWSELRPVDIRMGQPGERHGSSSYAESIGVRGERGELKYFSTRRRRN